MDPHLSSFRRISQSSGAVNPERSAYLLKNTEIPSFPNFSPYCKSKLWWTHCFAYSCFSSRSARYPATSSASEAPGTTTSLWALIKSQDSWNPLSGSLENSAIAGVISGTISSSSSSSSSSSCGSGGGGVEDEATDWGLRTSYSTVVVVLVFFLSVSAVASAPGRGAGSGLEGTYCNRGRDRRSANRSQPMN